MSQSVCEVYSWWAAIDRTRCPCQTFKTIGFMSFQWAAAKWDHIVTFIRQSFSYSGSKKSLVSWNDVYRTAILIIQNILEMKSLDMLLKTDTRAHFTPRRIRLLYDSRCAFCDCCLKESPTGKKANRLVALIEHGYYFAPQVWFVHLNRELFLETRCISLFTSNSLHNLESN